MAFKLPPPPTSNDFSSPSWQDWFYKLAAALQKTSTVTDIISTGGGFPVGIILGTGDPDGGTGASNDFEGVVIPGPRGFTGIQGVPGIAGTDGESGVDGQSVIGPQGLPGIQGPVGFALDGEDSASAWYAPGLPPPINSTGVELRQEVTGLLTGGLLTATPGGTTFNIATGTGQIIDNYTNPQAPLTLTPVSWTSKSAVVDAHLTDSFVYIFLDATASVIQQLAVPTDADLRSKILLGVIVHSGGVISAVGGQYVLAYSNGNLGQDLFTALGAITNGCLHSGISGALSIARSSGVISRRGAGYASNIAVPNSISLASASPAQVETFCRNGSNTVFSSATAVTVIVVNRYDDGTAATAGVPNGVVNNNQWQACRLFISPNGHTLLQYGQVIYNSLATAQASIGAEVFFEDPVLTLTSFRGYMFVRGGATDLSLPGDAFFASAGKLGDAGVAIAAAQGISTSVTNNYLIGLDGEPGDDGLIGPMGAPGQNGTNGNTGSIGPAGPAIFLLGESGDDGMMGPPGPAGASSSSSIGSWVLAFAAAHG